MDYRQFKITVRSGVPWVIPASDPAAALSVVLDHIAKEFKESIVSIDLVEPQSDLTRLCAVEQNEVVCAHPGCTGPYNCKERGLDLV